MHRFDIDLIPEIPALASASRNAARGISMARVVSFGIPCFAAVARQARCGSVLPQSEGTGVDVKLRRCPCDR
jgi:hypothetical protein